MTRRMSGLSIPMPTVNRLGRAKGLGESGANHHPSVSRTTKNYSQATVATMTHVFPTRNERCASVRWEWDNAA